MAVLALKTTQLGDDYRKRPTEDHGKLRIQAFSLPAVAVAGDANSTIDLCELPPGAVRILPSLSRLYTTAFGAGRTLDVGFRAYTKKDDGTQEVEDLDALIDGLDVSGAVNAAPFGTNLATLWKYDVYSKAGVVVTAQVLGGTIPVNATMNGYIVYVYE